MDYKKRSCWSNKKRQLEGTGIWKECRLQRADEQASESDGGKPDEKDTKGC